MHVLKTPDPGQADRTAAIHFEVEQPRRRAVRPGLLRR